MSSEISQCKYVQQGSPFAKRSDPHLAPVARFPRAAVVPVLWRLCERHNCAGSHHLLGSVAATSGVAATGVMAGTPQRNVACARHQRLVTASVQRRLRQAPPSRQRHERAVQVARSSSTRATCNVHPLQTFGQRDFTDPGPQTTGFTALEANLLPID
jgi:hypothetical protein